jgi:hypothetical protein
MGVTTHVSAFCSLSEVRSRKENFQWQERSTSFNPPTHEIPKDGKDFREPNAFLFCPTVKNSKDKVIDSSHVAKYLPSRSC